MDNKLDMLLLGLKSHDKEEYSSFCDLWLFCCDSTIIYKCRNCCFWGNGSINCIGSGRCARDLFYYYDRRYGPMGKC